MTGTLNVSDVEATVFNTGTLFGPSTEGAYFVPKTTHRTPIYAASVWISGRADGEVRAASTTLGQGGSNNDYFEFWPGPLNPGATLPNPADGSAYDRIWTVSVGGVATYEAGGPPTADLAAWPVGLGAPAVDDSGAPVETEERGRVIDLAAGVRPVLYGSQTAFWVMNDVGNVHRSTGSKPLGIEVQTSAFAVAAGVDALDRATVYRYTVVNRSPRPIDDVRVGFFTVVQLGNTIDDAVGADTTRGLAFAYNADEVDEGSIDVGSPPPAFGVDVLESPAASPHHGLSSFVYYVGGDANRGNPRNTVEYDRILRGVWRDGTPMTAYGNGYRTSGEVTTVAFRVIR